jgi:carboxymethylenebutenolidase
MAQELVDLTTRDGVCPTLVFTPGSGQGPWPAAIMYMDAFGVRPVLVDMAQRLADLGYVVLLPDLFYRLVPYAPIDPQAIFASGDVRGALGPYMASTDNRRAAADTAALLAYLDGRGDVAGQKVGVTGYCMGGGIALTVAGTYPERIAAAASFHGGSLATDSDLSPHLLVSHIAGRVYVGAAHQDGSYPPAMGLRLCEALMEADVDHVHEWYANALHGWTMADFPIYQAEAAERHWDRLATLFAETLRR